ncbi:MAG: putative toxin-antitoxin system toxin component, PIN family [Thermodesulfobacteriota bacterium]
MTVRVVIDTNVWVSALLNPSGFPAKLRTAFEKGLFIPVLSEPLVEELVEVLHRPRIRNKYDLDEKDIRELLILIDERAESVLLSGTVDICRDKDDNLVIETAIEGKAKYLVSRDDDIKLDTKIASYLLDHGITVVSVAKFLASVM